MFSVIKRAMENVTWKTIARTLLVTIIVIILSFSFINLSSHIADSINEESEWVNNMIKVTEPETLEYCVTTQQNNFLIRGLAVANDPVTLPELKGNFTAIRKIKYHYESHQETYTETYIDSKGNTKTRTRTRTVWDWERKGHDDYTASTVYLLGKSFDRLNTSYKYQEIDFSNYSNKPDPYWKDGHYNYEDKDTRYEYEVVPESYTTTFVSDYNLRLQKHYLDRTIEDITERKDTSWVYILFYSLIIILIFVAIMILTFWEELFSNFLCD